MRLTLGLVCAAALMALAACGGDDNEAPEPVAWDPAAADWSLEDEAAAAEVEAAELRVFQGAEHCDWQSVHFLELHTESGGIAAQFIRDPEGKVRTEPLPEPFEEQTERPDDALFAGWSAGEREVWIGAEGEYAYVGTEDASERWATTPSIIGCQ